MHTPKYVTPAYKTNPLSAIAAGKTGEPEEHVYQGGVDTTASKMVLTGNIIAGDLFTFGGVVFTAMASGAAGAYQFNVAGTLSLSLDALITKLNAATDATVAAFTYSKTDTDTAVTATPDLHSATLGNTTAALFVSTHDSVVYTRVATGRAELAVSLDTETTQFNSASAGNFTLADGDNGQDKNLVNIGAGSAVVYGTFIGGTKVTVPQNKAFMATWLGTMWRTAANDGCTIA